MSALDKYKLQNIQYLLNVTLNSECDCVQSQTYPSSEKSIVLTQFNASAFLSNLTALSLTYKYSLSAIIIINIIVVKTHTSDRKLIRRNLVAR